MAKKKLGNKFVCYQCGCKFYDLGRPKPICPKCGVDQDEAPAKGTLAQARTGVSAAPPPRSRGRRRRDDEASIGSSEPFSGEEVETDPPLEDGLSLIDDEELIGASAEDYPEEH